MNRIGRVGVLAAVGVIGLGLVSGCGGGAKPAASAVSARSVPSASSSVSAAPTSVLQLRFPVAAYELTTLQFTQVRYLELRLTQICMRSFGFDYLPQLSTSMIAAGVRATDEFTSRLYGVSDAEAASTYGYHLPTWSTDASAPQTIASLPRAEQDVLTGQGARTYKGEAIPGGGCLNQAASQLLQAGVGADAQRSSSGSLPGAIDMNAFESAQSDPRVLAVFAKWSSCMRSSGYSYATPFQVPADKRWLAVAAVSPIETQTAQRDIACKLRVNLIGVEYAVQSGYENAAITQNAAALTPLAEQIPTETAAINHLMAEYGH